MEPLIAQVKHRTLQINREISASCGDTWRHHNSPIEIGRAKLKEECGPASWDHGLSHVRDRGRPTKLHQIEQSSIPAKISFINTNVLTLYLNS